MQRVFLVGARASGKSTIGRSLAETLGCPFLDTDKELTRDLGCSIDVFVKENGWDAFRRKEHETLKRLARCRRGKTGRRVAGNCHGRRHGTPS